MWAPATRSEVVGADAVLRYVEHELRQRGRLSFETCEAMRVDPRLHGLEGCLAFLGAVVFAPSDQAPALPRRARIRACRLMLLSLGAHTATPRWPPARLELLFETALQLPGADLADVVHAQFSLFGETQLPATHAQRQLIDELGALVAGARRRGHSGEDLMWLALRVADPLRPVTPAQRAFADRVLPRRHRS